MRRGSGAQNILRTIVIVRKVNSHCSWCGVRRFILYIIHEQRTLLFVETAEMDGNAHLLSKCSTQEDVYALSADIGQEVERLVDGFGVDAASSLVPKLIRVLELLEAAVQQNETLRGEADQLFQTVCQLEYDKKEKAQFRKKFDQVNTAISNNNSNNNYLYTQ